MTVYMIQVRKADGTVLPPKNVLSANANGKDASVVAIEAALAQQDAGQGATVEFCQSKGSIDINATV